MVSALHGTSTPRRVRRESSKFKRKGRKGGKSTLVPQVLVIRFSLFSFTSLLTFLSLFCRTSVYNFFFTFYFFSCTTWLRACNSLFPWVLLLSGNGPTFSSDQVRYPGLRIFKSLLCSLRHSNIETQVTSLSLSVLNLHTFCQKE